MSYCRRNEKSDVYMYLNMAGMIECSCCSLAQDGWNSELSSAREALLHVRKHVLAGDLVPNEVVDKLMRDFHANE